jgi:hypothetical protein
VYEKPPSGGFSFSVSRKPSALKSNKKKMILGIRMMGGNKS